MSPTRRQFLLACTGGITALAGCSALSDPQQSILVAVNNYTDSRHQGHVLIERDGTELVHQYLVVGAADPDTGTSVYIGEPISCPTNNENWWISQPGRYRHIKRVDGRIDEVLWTYETTDAEEWYEQERRRANQREQLAKMSIEEVKAEWLGDTNQLDSLREDEIWERYETLREQSQNSGY